MQFQARWFHSTSYDVLSFSLVLQHYQFFPIEYVTWIVLSMCFNEAIRMFGNYEIANELIKWLNLKFISFAVCISQEEIGAIFGWFWFGGVCFYVVLVVVRSC